MRPVVTEFPDIGVTAVSRWIFNCYVIHDGGAGRAVIVDAGIPSLGRWVADWLSERADRSAPVIVATHGHSDHVGGIPALAERCAGSVLLPERIADYRAGERPRSPGPRQVAKIWPVMRDQPFQVGSLVDLVLGARRIGYDARSVRFPDEPTGWLRDGNQLDDAPDWQVLSVPGHTDDSTALFNSATGVLLSGDAVLSASGRAWFTPELVDEARADETETRLRPLAVRYLLPGHGRPVAAADVMRHALSHRDRP